MRARSWNGMGLMNALQESTSKWTFCQNIHLLARNDLLHVGRHTTERKYLFRKKWPKGQKDPSRYLEVNRFLV